jgi:hypothetical protein
MVAGSIGDECLIRGSGFMNDPVTLGERARVSCMCHEDANAAGQDVGQEDRQREKLAAQESLDDSVDHALLTRRPLV